MRIKRYIASEYCALDSDVMKGGGTDDTAALQALLDEADENTGVYLYLDGAALVHGLKVHSNTTIECASRDCGFYLADDSNCSIVTNYNWDNEVIRTRNISLIGGTYNHNCAHQVHHYEIAERTPELEVYRKLFDGVKYIFALEFIGVENVTMRDMTICNQRTFTLTAINWRNFVVENLVIELYDYIKANNQDGLHFFGPGQFLTIRNIRGCAGDDFIALAPDELDCRSDITDVLIDGVVLDHSDQGIRLLSRGTGKLDRVTIKNVTGTYKSFGFYINNWFPSEEFGDFGSIYFENIDLRSEEKRYDYRDPMLFSVGGNIECLTVKNLRHHHSIDSRALFELGLPSYDMEWQYKSKNKPKLKNVIIDGLTITDEAPESTDASYIQIFDHVENLVIKDALLLREDGAKAGSLVEVKEKGSLGKLIISDSDVGGFDTLISGKDRIDSVIKRGVNE